MNQTSTDEFNEWAPPPPGASCPFLPSWQKTNMQPSTSLFTLPAVLLGLMDSEWNFSLAASIALISLQVGSPAVTIELLEFSIGEIYTTGEGNSGGELIKHHVPLTIESAFCGRIPSNGNRVRVENVRLHVAVIVLDLT